MMGAQLEVPIGHFRWYGDYMKRKRLLKLGILATAAYAARRWLVSRRTGVTPAGDGAIPAEAPAPVAERRSTPDPEALHSASETPGGAFGFDIERLKSLKASTYKPVVEYLSYIQVQRGDDKSIVFVRERDVESLAALTGGSREKFVDEFQQLGVLLFMN